MNYYIKNATLVNEGQTFVASVFVSDGKIAKIIRESQVPELVEGPVDTESAFRQAQRPSTQVIDATGKYLIPGIIDEHVHFREPGLTHKHGEPCRRGRWRDFVHGHAQYDAANYHTRVAATKIRPRRREILGQLFLLFGCH